jgi:hypothetical protein
MNGKRNPDLLSKELREVGILTEQVDQLMGERAEGEQVDEGLKVIRKKVGGAARRLKLKAKKYYRKFKGKLKRAARKWKKSSAGKRFARLVKRYKTRVGKILAKGGSKKRISYSSTNSPASNLAERIQAEARGLFESEVSDERGIMLENYTTGAELALGFTLRYAGMGKDDVAEQMMNVAEGLLDLADNVEAGTVENTEALSISELGAFRGLLACAEDYFRNYADEEGSSFLEDDDD